MVSDDTYKQRLLERSAVNPTKITDGVPCREWQGYCYKGGYGRLEIRRDGGRKAVAAHRLSYELNVGPIGNSLVCHKCDNPVCIEPTHLFLGDHQVNSDDKVRKARQCRGELQARAVLTERQVEQIKYLLEESTMSSSAIGRKFGVRPQVVGYIKAGKTWRHVQSKK